MVTLKDARDALFGPLPGFAAEPDPHYSALLYDLHGDVRDRLASEWLRFAPLADSQFLKELRLDPHARLWEMRVANILLDAGLDLASSDSGPDFVVTNVRPRIWVECVAAMSGVGDNKVPEPPVGEVFRDNEAPRLLRYSSSILSKHRKWEDKYVPQGYVGADEGHVVALNVARVPMSGVMDHKKLPWIVRMLYGLAHDFVSFSKKGTTRDGVQTRLRLRKPSGTDVTTALFVDPKFASLSGVFYSAADAFNTQQSWAQPVFVHNPNATVPLAPGWLSASPTKTREFYVDEERHIIEFEG